MNLLAFLLDITSILPIELFCRSPEDKKNKNRNENMISRYHEWYIANFY